jgi:hypothetical protein
MCDARRWSSAHIGKSVVCVRYRTELSPIPVHREYWLVAFLRFALLCLLSIDRN